MKVLLKFISILLSSRVILVYMRTVFLVLIVLVTDPVTKILGYAIVLCLTIFLIRNKEANSFLFRFPDLIIGLLSVIGIVTQFIQLMIGGII